VLFQLGLFHVNPVPSRQAGKLVPVLCDYQELVNQSSNAPLVERRVKLLNHVLHDSFAGSHMKLGISLDAQLILVFNGRRSKQVYVAVASPQARIYARPI